ncbi:MAG: PepSY domain-containing protein, partial [Porphyrobacter sp.]|nr:PepSY domain-containing protein [Porphyrobacter sp.]
HAMNWAHTWLGVVLGIVMFAVFWMGTLTIFAPEIDQWMIPETRIIHQERDISYDRLLAELPPEARASAYINFVVPTERHTAIGFFYQDADGTFHDSALDPATGQPLPLTDSLAASGFFYPFHLSLMIEWQNLGYWIVGLAALAMLILLVSGLFVHRKIIAEFFVFRPHRKARRATLDLHNLSSLIGLPFYFLMPFSGLLIFAFLYLPWGISEAFDGDMDAAYAEMSGDYAAPPRSGRPAVLASVDAMKREAEALWSVAEGAPVKTNLVRVLNHGDQTAVVYFRNTFPEDRVVLSKYVAVFDGASGKLIRNFSKPPIGEAKAWIEGAHFVQFGHWPLRWLYFAGGLGGCVMIATGMLFWLRSRQSRLAQTSPGYRVVEAMTIGGVSGIILASAAFLLANRLLPADAAVAGLGRAELEVRVFWLVWLATFIHAALVRERAWGQQCLAIAAAGTAAVLLNAATTPQYVLSDPRGLHLPVAIMDMVLLAGTVLAGWAAWQLAPKKGAPQIARAFPAE